MSGDRLQAQLEFLARMAAQGLRMPSLEVRLDMGDVVSLHFRAHSADEASRVCNDKYILPEERRRDDNWFGRHLERIEGEVSRFVSAKPVRVLLAHTAVDARQWLRKHGRNANDVTIIYAQDGSGREADKIRGMALAPGQWAHTSAAVDGVGYRDAVMAIHDCVERGS